MYQHTLHPILGPRVEKRIEATCCAPFPHAINLIYYTAVYYYYYYYYYYCSLFRLVLQASQ